MRLSVLVVAALVILINCTEQGAASEEDNPDGLKENYDDADERSLDYDVERENNATTTVTDETYLNGNESFEESNTTTPGYSSTKRDETKEPSRFVADPEKCGDPPSVKNALIFEGKQAEYKVGAKVRYACDFGYIIDGSVHFSECRLAEETQTLYWTDPETRCSPRSCGDPGYVVHAHRVGSVYTFPNKVSFECEDGYTLQGYGTRFCQTSGTWSGNLPTCEPIFCDPPENPENGKVSYSSLGYESELRYECDPGFLLKNGQSRTCAGNGTWTGTEPICQEAQCDPPVVPEHGAFQIIGDKTSIGSRVLYTCNGGRILSGSTSSKCLDTGEWTFPTPKCLEPCFVPKLHHGKIGRYVSYYRRKNFNELTENSNLENGEELYLRCEPNYEPFGTPETEVKIKCANGEWEKIPVCEPAKCRGPPPPTLNAVVARANITHGGGVVYHCFSFAKKTVYGNVTCNFGSWKGVTPVCKDLRCSMNELKFPGLIQGKQTSYRSGQKFKVSCEPGFNITKQNNQLVCKDGTWEGHLPPCISASCNTKDLIEWEGFVPDEEVFVLNGEFLKVRCQEGYSPSEFQPRCNKGRWTGIRKLCQEKNCILHRIENGGFSAEVENTRWFSSERSYKFQRIHLGGTVRPGSNIYVSCDKGYSFQGKGEENVMVKCSKGKWDPDPVCLITGTPYRNEAKVSLEESEKSQAKTDALANRSASATRQTFLLTTQSWTSGTTPYPPCICTYHGVDESLVAFVGTQQLVYGSTVKKNDVVKFHCKHIGYSRLNGVSELKCESCRVWHSSEFPDCVPPRQGDTELQFIGVHAILPGGIIGVEEGRQLIIRCASVGIQDFPNWQTNTHQQFVVAKYINGQGRFINDLTIPKVYSQHSGHYQCYMEGYWSSAFDIQVISKSIVKCSKFDERDFTIHYDKEQAQNSSATFYCKGNSKKLVGPNVLTCLPNGQWSGNPPKCKTICPQIKETEGMAISYTNNLDSGSTATFHCFPPRTLMGVYQTWCQRNGEWSNPPANCLLPSCYLYQLYEVVPENVIPAIEGLSDTLPYNFSLRLTCEDNLMLSGSDVAKCGQDGKWQISKIQCITGCGFPKSENSELIIDPNKSFYKFGESVSLTCSSGYRLDSEVVRLMCLGTSWSESVPGCVKE